MGEEHPLGNDKRRLTSYILQNILSRLPLRLIVIAAELFTYSKTLKGCTYFAATVIRERSRMYYIVDHISVASHKMVEIVGPCQAVR